MKERPIIFSADSIRAILDDRKTQTRRVMKVQPVNKPDIVFASPYGQPGDRLWVRESFWVDDGSEYGPLVFYAATDCRSDIPLKPSIHMPRLASRITLEIVNVRVEQLQEISKADARAEGMYCGFTDQYDFPIGPYDAYTANYRRLWDRLNAKRGYPWDSNPYVWVLEFKRLP